MSSFLQELLNFIDQDGTMTKEEMTAKMFGRDDLEDWFGSYYKMVINKELDPETTLHEYCVTVESFLLLTLVDGNRWVYIVL